MIKVKFEWTGYTHNKTDPIPDQEFNTEKEMLDFALNKHQDIIVTSWRTNEVHYVLSKDATEEEKRYDYEIELYDDYRE